MESHIVDVKPLSNLCSLLWDQLQVAEAEWTKAAQGSTGFQATGSADGAEPQLSDKRATASTARRETAGSDRELKYETWRLLLALDDLSRPATDTRSAASGELRSLQAPPPDPL